jgi:hypothetical protein
MGQRKKQVIYILMAVYTYDGYQQARAAIKMYDQIAGTSSITISEREIQDAIDQGKYPMKKPEEGEEEEEPEEGEQEKIERVTSTIRREKVIALYMRVYGQRAYKHQITDLGNPMECGAAEETALEPIKRM